MTNKTSSNTKLKNFPKHNISSSSYDFTSALMIIACLIV
jgi:hypothetical protein